MNGSAQMMTDIEGIFLDLDNTLIDSKGAYNYSLGKIQKYWLKTFKEDNFIEIFENKKKEVKNRLHTLPYHRSRIFVFKELVDERKKKLDSETILHLDKLYFRYFLEFINNYILYNKKNYKNLFKLIKRLALSKKISILTNESLRTQLLKTRTFLPKNLNLFLYTSEEIGIEKPSEKYFSYILNKNSLDPHRVVMIGDSLEDDIIGALNIGMRALRVKSVFGEDSIEEHKINNFSYTLYGSTIQALKNII